MTDITLSDDWCIYKEYHKECKKKVRQSYWSFLMRYQINPFEDLSKDKDRTQLAFPLSKRAVKGDLHAFDRKEKANTFNEKFCSVFTTEDIQPHKDGWCLSS